MCPKFTRAETVQATDVTHLIDKHRWTHGGCLSVIDTDSAELVSSVSVKRRHSVFDAQYFGQNAQKRKTVRQVTQRIFR